MQAHGASRWNSRPAVRMQPRGDLESHHLPSRPGGRWLRHIVEKHGGDDDVLAGSIED
jgi:hypothetical protein